MSGVAKKLMSASGGAGGGFTAIEDVFSTYLYTGNGSTQTITNGIDLAGEGGLVWIKGRNAATNHALVDTERGGANSLASDTTDAQRTDGAYGLTFNSDGFDSTGGNLNVSGRNQASWTFRKAPRFFDVVTYTGDGTTNRAIPHNLGTTVGSIIIKCTSFAGTDWVVWHRGLGATDFLRLNLTNAAATDSSKFSQAPTDTNFYVGNDGRVNVSGRTHVAYLFAHDPLGPSGDGSDGLIDCGSYTGNSAGVEINLGWEPQWFMCKKTNGTSDWQIFDTMRGMHFGTSTQSVRLSPNTSGAETSQLIIGPSPTGVSIPDASDSVNITGGNYIYIAIRRGPMRAPESGTEVFDLQADTKTQPYTRTFAFPPDLVLVENRGSPRDYIVDRLRGKQARISTHTTDAEQVGSDFVTLDAQDSVTVANLHGVSYSSLDYAFRRAPEFFDVVAYTGNGVAGRTVPHNLGVAPEMMIVKKRSGSDPWAVYHTGTPRTGVSSNIIDYLNLNTTNAAGTLPSANVVWNNTEPTNEVFTLGLGGVVNESPATYIAYLFSTLAGISKVGSYTGNGTSQTINCGFTSSARFIIIKRTDSTGDWYVWDTARGIVAANDPHLSLNTTAAEVTTDDSIDPDSSGFIVNQVAATNINVSAASYIFYAVS